MLLLLSEKMEVENLHYLKPLHYICDLMQNEDERILTSIHKIRILNSTILSESQNESKDQKIDIF